MTANPNFPSKVWDGITDRDGNLTNRDKNTLNVSARPTPRDWDQIIVEMQQVQASILALPDGQAPSAIADEDLMIGQLIRVKSNGHIVLADATQSPDVVGMSLEDVISGDIAQYTTNGPVVNLAWSLNPGDRYFLGTNGGMTLTPITGWLIQLGTSLTQQVFNLNIQQAIRL